VAQFPYGSVKEDHCGTEFPISNCLWQKKTLST